MHQDLLNTHMSCSQKVSTPIKSIYQFECDSCKDKDSQILNGEKAETVSDHRYEFDWVESSNKERRLEYSSFDRQLSSDRVLLDSTTLIDNLFIIPMIFLRIYRESSLDFCTVLSEWPKVLFKRQLYPPYYSNFYRHSYSSI